MFKLHQTHRKGNMMKQTVTLTANQIGDAIVRYVGMKLAGLSFFPYHIKESDLRIPSPIKISLTGIARQQALEPAEKGPRKAVGDQLEVELSREEIVEAIWLLLPLETLQGFEKPQAEDFSFEIPDSATFKLCAIPRGGLTRDYQHALAEQEP